MLNAFKLKPFNLEPIFAEWIDGPVFLGNPKKDLPVDEWLEKVREGCIERGVPEEYWYKVAQHFMGPKAKARLDQLKQVIVKVHGGKYRWTWKKFKVAVQNMGWAIDKDAKETIKVQGKASGLWFMRKSSESEKVEENERPAPSRSNSIWLLRKPLVDEPAEEPVKEPVKPAPSRPTTRQRSGTTTTFWPGRLNSKDDSELKELPCPPKERRITKSPSPSRSNTLDVCEVVTAETQVPIWLLNACTALDYITSEHPKTMSIISAILITAGSIPAIPAIAAGAGGVVLASSAVQAVGVLAVGLGQVLNTTIQKHEATASSTVR
ncbi:hypothetical protein BYT27DRAFT_7133669 [Phlegmacium glaucopus]|nr:hypothetical protein BYT27DRAFT_7133669 [Phlegmacium glaucopus]